MKTNPITFRSKAAKMLIAAAALVTIGFSACKKDNANTPSTTNTVTEADAAQVTTDAVVPQTGGMVDQVNNSVTIYNSAIIPCGTTKDSTIAKSSATGATPSYSYSLNWNYILSCSTGTFTLNHTGTNAYDGALSSSTGNSTGKFVLSGLLPASSDYIVNTTYSRTGSTTSKIARQYTFTTDLTIVSANIKIDKTTQKIVSGTSTVTLACTSPKGTVHFGGTITYLGGNKAILVLNSSVSYPIQW